MKKSFHMISLLALLLTFAVSTAWAAQRTLEPDGKGGYYINMPGGGTDTLVIPGDVSTFKLYDDRGADLNFSLNCDGNLVLIAPEGRFIRLRGRMMAKVTAGYYKGMSSAILTVYNNEIDNDSIAFYMGGDEDVRLLSSGQVLILNFANMASRTPSEGLDITVSIVEPDGEFAIDEVSVTGGNLVNPPATAAAGDVVSVTASTAAEGYVFDHIEVKDERGNSVEITGGTWLTSKTATFVMPATNAIVEPIYVTEEQGVHLHMPYEGVSRVSIPEDVESFILDGDGGEFEVSKPLVLTAPEGYLLQMEGLRSDVAHSYDDGSAYYVYDGDVPNAYESQTELITRMSSSQTVTIVFVASGEFTGTMRMTLVDANQPHYINAQSSSSGMGDIEAANVGYEGAPVGTRVKLVAHPAEGYLFSGIVALNDDDWSTLGVEIIEDSVWFTMPFANVRIIPDFAPVDNPYFLVPSKGVATKEITEEQGFSEISICDNGGCNDFYGRYNGNGDGTLVLTAPEGYLLYVYGSVDAASQDYLEIFDGADTNANRLVNVLGSNYIDDINSSTRSLTFRFRSSGYAQGFNMTVGLINASEEHSIFLNPYFTGGTVSIDKETAAMGDTVTLTFNPEEGYLLNGVRVMTASYNMVNVMGGMWYSGNEAKFVMPLSDVQIYAEFDKPEDGGFGIQIPRNDTLRLTLPEKMSWVWVYVESDEQYNYYDNSDGVLELTAPNGHFIDAAGYNYTADEGDFMAIYDGIGEGAERIQLPTLGDYETISTGNRLTFRFKSNESGNDEGLGIPVTILKSRPEPSAVMVYELANGIKYTAINGSYSGAGVVNIAEDIEVNSVSFNREFTSGAFSTFVLPFNYNAGDIWGLEQVLEFAGVGELDGKKVVKMRRVWCQEDVSEKCASLAGNLEANKPYMLKTRSSNIYFDDPVTLKKTTEAVTTVGDWQFRGTYSYKTWAEGDSDLGCVYGFAGSNADNINIGDFVKAGAGAWINPLRAYLIYNPNRGNAAPPAYAPVRDRVDIPEEMDVVIIDDDDNIGEKTMAIGRINTRTGVFTSNRSYDLKGRSVNSAPKAKGVYVKGKR